MIKKGETMKNMCEHKKDSWTQEPKFFLIPDLKSRAKRINHYLLFFAFLLLAFTVCSSLYTAYAEAAEAIGKLTHVEGQVDILKEGKLPAVPAKVGDAVSVKDVIRTKSDAKAEITFDDKNVLKIAHRTRIDISEYISDGRVSKAVINMPRGKVEANVAPQIVQRIAISPTANKFEIRTPTAVAGVRGTEFFTFHDKGVTGVFVKEGKVEIYNPKFPDVKVTVSAGQVTTVPENKPPTPPRTATESEKKTHEKDVTPAEKPKEKAEEGEPAPTFAVIDPTIIPPPPAADMGFMPPTPIIIIPPPPITETTPLPPPTRRRPRGDRGSRPAFQSEQKLVLHFQEADL